MRNIKVKYYCKDVAGEIFSFIITIEELERAKLNINTYGRIQEIVARCQFTSLKDKNGKESYHHDLFVHPGRNSDSPIEIIWHDGAWWGQYDKEGNFMFRLTTEEMSISEIIANIHENPELLTKQSEDKD